MFFKSGVIHITQWWMDSHLCLNSCGNYGGYAHESLLVMLLPHIMLDMMLMLQTPYPVLGVLAVILGLPQV